LKIKGIFWHPKSHFWLVRRSQL